MSVLSYFKKNMISIIILVAILVAVCLYIGYAYVHPRLNQIYHPNREFDSEIKVKKADILFFYVNWCPHSTKALDPWNALSSQYDGREYKGTLLNFHKIDCEDETNNAIIDQHNITGYPTIKLVKENGTVEFNANPTQSSLQLFLDNAL